MRQITISRWHGSGKISRKNWKGLISSLALAGYEIYADKENIVFTLGQDDQIKDKEEKCQKPR